MIFKNGVSAPESDGLVMLRDNSIEFACSVCSEQLDVKEMSDGLIKIIPCTRCIQKTNIMYSRIKRFVEEMESDAHDKDPTYHEGLQGQLG